MKKNVAMAGFFVWLVKSEKRGKCLVCVFQREKVPSNETPAVTKSVNMYIWVVSTSNQHFRRASYSEAKFSIK